MTRPTPRPLASVTRLRTTGGAGVVTVSVDEYAALCALAATSAVFVREVRSRRRAQQHTVPRREFDKIEDRVLKLDAIMTGGKGSA